MLTEEQIERYQRHIALKEVGGKGQQRLLDGRVLIIGAGGLGAPAALYLAAAGVGTIGLVDADVVDLTNLIHVDFKHLNKVAEELGDAQQKVASCGARVRVPVACGGCEYNPKGLMDTQESAREIDAKLFGIETGHHKFKVALTRRPSCISYSMSLT